LSCSSMSSRTRIDMAASVEVPVTVDLAVNGIVVGPDELLVVNLGPRASDYQVDEAHRRILDLFPSFAGRVLICAVDGLAAVGRGTGD
jgi:hypothetical protein